MNQEFYGTDLAKYKLDRAREDELVAEFIDRK